MIDIDELDEKFSIEGEVGFFEFEEDMVSITVSNKFAEAEISLYGAHVLNFRPHRRLDVLWISPESFFEPGKPIRGGIPVCFPWFGPHPTDSSKPQHGFARLMNWEVVSTATLPSGETEVVLGLSSTEETKELWPQDFSAEMKFNVGSKLTVSLKVTNTSEAPYQYSCALHSYYTISALDNISIEGLEKTTYFDQLTGEHNIQEEKILQFEDALTRHYLNTESTVVINDPVFKRRIKVEKAGSKVTTVWNPGEEACEKIADLAEDSFHEFVCVEATNAFEYPVSLAPGESFETATVIGLADPSSWE